MGKGDGGPASRAAGPLPPPHDPTTTTARRTRRAIQTTRHRNPRGQFLAHRCTGPYRYEATLAQVDAITNGEVTVKAYCEAGELLPATGELRIWVGDGKSCPRGGGKPTYTAVRVGK